MAIVVVGGSGRNVGKTALICGLIAALPEFAWIAIKITSHTHGPAQPIWEEIHAGQGTDTARFLAAGARRAFLITAAENDLSPLFRDLRAMIDPAIHLIFESNRILDYIQPDICLAVSGPTQNEHKPSFTKIMEQMDAIVISADRDEIVATAKPIFKLATLNRIPHQMQQWVRHRLPQI